MRKFTTLFAAVMFMLFMSAVTWAHHMAPDELQDFITAQLTDVDSPHLDSSDTDPSLLDVVVPGMVEVDYVLVYYDLTIDQVVYLIEATVTVLSTDTTVEDYSYLITPEDDGEFTLTFYIDYK